MAAVGCWGRHLHGKVPQALVALLAAARARVEALLLRKGKELRALAKNLYWYDYLDAKEMDLVLKGKSLEKERVREWKEENASADPSSSRPLVTF